MVACTSVTIDHNDLLSKRCVGYSSVCRSRAGRSDGFRPHKLVKGTESTLAY
jgi:hypothetical protein